MGSLSWAAVILIFRYFELSANLTHSSLIRLPWHRVGVSPVTPRMRPTPHCQTFFLFEMENQQHAAEVASYAALS